MPHALPLRVAEAAPDSRHRAKAIVRGVVHGTEERADAQGGAFATAHVVPDDDHVKGIPHSGLVFGLAFPPAVSARAGTVRSVRAVGQDPFHALVELGR